MSSKVKNLCLIYQANERITFIFFRKYGTQKAPY